MQSREQVHLKISDNLFFEKQLVKQGYECIAGIDEVGRGCLCGPVVAAAVVMPKGLSIAGVTDSKLLSPKHREELAILIRENAVAWALGLVQPQIIDRINILEATKLAMTQAVARLKVKPDYLLIDAVQLKKIEIPQTSLIKGDLLSHSIAAASIIAKVVRDCIMMTWARQYPVYQLDSNKGYASKSHIKALEEHGPSPLHRLTFRKVCDCRRLFF